jgi:hypothetical protein
MRVGRLLCPSEEVLWQECQKGKGGDPEFALGIFKDDSQLESARSNFRKARIYLGYFFVAE